MNERKVVGGIFCDFQKAFEYINHNILLTKLEFYRVTGTILNLINSYLEGRYQEVILENYLENSNADWKKNKARCPTGINTWSIAFLTLHK
jgi:hypothetical protein